MKKMIAGSVLFFLLILPALAAANPVPDEDDQNIVLVARSQSICVVLLNLVTGKEHRLVRESDAGDELLLDDQPIADADLTADGRYVVPDLCVPAGLVTYRLYRKSGGEWNEYAGSGVATFVSEFTAACADEAAVCDGAAAEAEPEEGADDPVCGCAVGAGDSTAAWVLPVLLLLGLLAWRWAGRVA
ncbi:MAG: hypothetical protein GX444_18895 [Myxococcales bacterium]|nr:hypothetical protein [Myxococcales bacterium]